MKKLHHIFLLFLLLSACTSKSQYDAMRRGLDSLNERNRSDQPFTAADVQPYVDFFDSHGTSNDQLLAYYLLGRSYHEQGEAPMALKYYQQAIECADTTDADCDFGQLSRVYGQMGRLFYEQSLFRHYLSSSKIAERYSWKAKDTLAALICYEQQSVAYRELGNLDSSLFIAKTVANHYSKLGYHSDAAIALGGIVHTLIKMGRLLEARKCMAIYESESGLFNDFGDIEKGREIYYAVKGLYYLRINRLDSAEYYYRKELTRGKDFNNQNGGALGLAMIYDLQQRKDSSSKYYSYAYAMNDSMYAQMVTDEIERMHTMYDYSRHEINAYYEKEKSSRRAIIISICMCVIIVITVMGIIIIKEINHKRHEIELKYRHSLEIIRQARRDIEKLQTDKIGGTDLIAEKEQIISHQKVLMEGLSKRPLIYRQFFIKGQKPTSEEWLDLEEQIINLYPSFNEFLKVHSTLLNEKERKTCILIKAGFKPKTISSMLDVGPSYISNIRTHMLEKLFGQVGTPKDFDKRIMQI